MKNQGIYDRLFPFEKIPQGSRLLIYGVGAYGKAYLRQLQLTKYCELVGFIDQHYAQFQESRYPVYAPEEIGHLEYDYVLIAIQSPYVQENVEKNLVRLGVVKDCIVRAEKRNEGAIPSFWKEKRSQNKGRAYETASETIAVHMINGIGDMIVAKKAVDALISLNPEVHLDIYYQAHENLLQYLFCETPQVEHVIPIVQWEFEKEIDSYGLAIMMCGTGGIQVLSYHSDCFSAHPTYQKQLDYLVDVERRYASEMTISEYDRRIRCLYHGWNCYTVYGREDSLPISDRKIALPRPLLAKREFGKMGLHRYITVSNGIGDYPSKKNRAKAWPDAYHERFLQMFHAKYPDIEIVQIGGIDCKELQQADRRILGKPFDFVAEILRHALFHLDIEGGLVHLAAQTGTKCIVLFGPTLEKYYGYPENINLHAGNCYGCNALYSRPNVCARDMDEPECMYSITPEMVMEHATDYLEKCAVGR